MSNGSSPLAPVSEEDSALNKQFGDRWDAAGLQLPSAAMGAMSSSWFPGPDSRHFAELVYYCY